MSAPASDTPPAPSSRLPEWLRPRDRERPGTGSLRLVESTLLIVVAVILATATINDVGRQVDVDHRLSTDLRTWRHYTGHDYRNLSVDEELLGRTTQHEVVCGNTAPGAPKSRTQICLAIWGPVVNGRRHVYGGWYLPPGSEDQASQRYGCFGEGAEGICPG